MSQVLFHPLVGGFLLAAILAAIMSTISSQLLVTSSSLTEDFYKLIRGEEHAQSHQKEFVLVGRLSVLAVAIVALAIAWSPNDTILNLVGNAWAGFGARLVHLFFFFILEKLTRAGAISGMIAGALVVIIWIVGLNHLLILMNYLVCMKLYLVLLVVSSLHTLLASSPINQTILLNNS